MLESLFSEYLSQENPKINHENLENDLNTICAFVLNATNIIEYAELEKVALENRIVTTDLSTEYSGTYFSEDYLLGEFMRGISKFKNGSKKQIELAKLIIKSSNDLYKGYRYLPLIKNFSDNQNIAFNLLNLVLDKEEVIDIERFEYISRIEDNIPKNIGDFIKKKIIDYNSKGEGYLLLRLLDYNSEIDTKFADRIIEQEQSFNMFINTLSIKSIEEILGIFRKFNYDSNLIDYFLDVISKSDEEKVVLFLNNRFKPILNYYEKEENNLDSKIKDIIDSSKIEIQDYSLLKKISSKGSTADTFLLKSKDENLSSLKFVLKIYNEDKVNIDEVKRNNLISQIPIQERIHLCDIINSGEIVEVDGKKKYAMLMHYRGKSLRQILDEKGKLGHRIAEKYFKQMIEAIEVLNKYNHIHGDIRPDNIFIDENGFVSLGDFGISVDKENFIFKDNRRYRPPKGYKGETPDLFSAGLVLYEMLKGEHLIVPRGSYENSEEFAREVDKRMNDFYEGNRISARYGSKIKTEAINEKSYKEFMMVELCLKKNANIWSLKESKKYWY